MVCYSRSCPAYDAMHVLYAFDSSLVLKMFLSWLAILWPCMSCCPADLHITAPCPPISHLWPRLQVCSRTGFGTDARQALPARLVTLPSPPSGAMPCRHYTSTSRSIATQHTVSQPGYSCAQVGVCVLGARMGTGNTAAQHSRASAGGGVKAASNRPVHGSWT
jgi:hypothetical protein